jgi:hypothetical protein
MKLLIAGGARADTFSGASHCTEWLSRGKEREVVKWEQNADRNEAGAASGAAS